MIVTISKLVCNPCVVGSSPTLPHLFLNMKTIICPDVHSRDYYKSLLSNTEDKIIFLGDYGDPYRHEGYDDDDTIEAMYDIFSFAQDNPNRVVLLIGNHKISNFS